MTVPWNYTAVCKERFRQAARELVDWSGLDGSALTNEEADRVVAAIAAMPEPEDEPAPPHPDAMARLRDLMALSDAR